MDNQVAIWCTKLQEFSCSDILLSVSEVLYGLMHTCHIHLMAQYLLGQQNIWADRLSWFTKSSVDWYLQKMLHFLKSRFSHPDIDPFVTPDSHLPFYLTRDHQTEAVVPDTFTVNHSRWQYIYLLPSLATSFLWVCHHLQSYSRRLLLIAPW